MNRRRARPRWPRLLVALGLGAVLAVILFLGWLAYSLNGGWPLPRTDPHDPRVEAAHDRWAPAFEDLHAVMVAELETAGLVVLSVNEVDTCREGETNWKRRDAYGLRCSLTWQAVLGGPAGDPTRMVTADHETAETRSERSGGPDGTQTLLSTLGSFEEASQQLASASYYGRIEVGEEHQPVRLEAFATRAPREYPTDDPIHTSGDVVRAATGPDVPELEQIQREWVRPAGSLEDARWLVRLTERVDYFAR